MRTMNTSSSSPSSFKASAINNDKKSQCLSSYFFCVAVMKEDNERNLSSSWSFKVGASNDDEQPRCSSLFYFLFFIIFIFFATVKARCPLQVWRLTHVMTTSSMLTHCHSSFFLKEIMLTSNHTTHCHFIFIFLQLWNKTMNTSSLSSSSFEKALVTTTSNVVACHHSNYFPRVKGRQWIVSQLVDLFKFWNRLHVTTTSNNVAHHHLFSFLFTIVKENDECNSLSSSKLKKKCQIIIVETWAFISHQMTSVHHHQKK
jgi:hypothetical protein